MLTARETPIADNRRDIRRVTQLGFAQDLAPQAMDGYLGRDQAGLVKVARLPASYLGAAAVVASVFVPQQCRLYDYNCRRLQVGVRTATAIGGVASILSGLKKYSDTKAHAQASRLSECFQNEVSPQVVDVEGRTLKLTPSAEEQYREWRELLHQMNLEHRGLPSDATPEAPLPAIQPVALAPAH